MKHTDKEESFEEMGDNLALLNVFNQNGIDITQSCSVEITLSNNALLGLGTELIRLAYQYMGGKYSCINPIEKKYVVQSLAAMLPPESYGNYHRVWRF